MTLTVEGHCHQDSRQPSLLGPCAAVTPSRQQPYLSKGFPYVTSLFHELTTFIENKWVQVIYVYLLHVQEGWPGSWAQPCLCGPSAGVTPSGQQPYRVWLQWGGTVLKGVSTGLYWGVAVGFDNKNITITKHSLNSTAKMVSLDAKSYFPTTEMAWKSIVGARHVAPISLSPSSRSFASPVSLSPPYTFLKVCSIQ